MDIPQAQPEMSDGGTAAGSGRDRRGGRERQIEGAGGRSVAEELDDLLQERSDTSPAVAEMPRVPKFMEPNVQRSPTSKPFAPKLISRAAWARAWPDRLL